MVKLTSIVSFSAVYDSSGACDVGGDGEKTEEKRGWLRAVIFFMFSSVFHVYLEYTTQADFLYLGTSLCFKPFQ